MMTFVWAVAALTLSGISIVAAILATTEGKAPGSKNVNFIGLLVAISFAVTALFVAFAAGGISHG